MQMLSHSNGDKTDVAALALNSEVQEISQVFDDNILNKRTNQQTVIKSFIK